MTENLSQSGIQEAVLCAKYASSISALGKSLLGRIDLIFGANPPFETGRRQRINFGIHVNVKMEINLINFLRLLHGDAAAFFLHPTLKAARPSSGDTLARERNRDTNQ